MKYSVVQIPFFVCNILLLKYDIATRHLNVIVISAFIGLLVNIGLSLLLMPKMGLSGIALATSIAMVFSSVTILITLLVKNHLNYVYTTAVLLNWLLFLILILVLSFHNLPSILMIIFLFFYFKLTYTKGNLFEAKYI